MYLVAKPPKLSQEYGQSWFYFSGALGTGDREDILDLVEDDAGGLVDAEQAHNGGQHGNSQHELKVGAREEEHIVVFNALRRVIVLALRRLRLGLLAEGRGPRRGGSTRGRRLGARRSSHGVGSFPRCGTRRLVVTIGRSMPEPENFVVGYEPVRGARRAGVAAAAADTPIIKRVDV